MKNRETALQGIRVIVTGAGGFIGAALARRLAETGAVVLGLVRSDLPELSGNYARFMRCDLSDLEEVRKVFLEFSPEVVYHLASNADAADSFVQIRASVFCNLLLTLNVLEAFAHCPDRRLLVYGDSTKVYGDCAPPYRKGLPLTPLCSYAIAKASGWEYCKLFQLVHDLPSVSIRPTITYGPGQKLNLVSFVIDSILKGEKEIVRSGGDQTRDLLFVDDCVEAFILAGAQAPQKMGGQVINIGGGNERSVFEIAKFIATLFESDIPIVSRYSLRRPTEISRCYCDNKEPFELLGWKPSVSLKEGLMMTIKHRKSKYGKYKDDSKAKRADRIAGC